MRSRPRTGRLRPQPARQANQPHRPPTRRLANAGRRRSASRPRRRFPATVGSPRPSRPPPGRLPQPAQGPIGWERWQYAKPARVTGATAWFATSALAESLQAVRGWRRCPRPARARAGPRSCHRAAIRSAPAGSSHRQSVQSPSPCPPACGQSWHPGLARPDRRTGRRWPRSGKPWLCRQSTVAKAAFPPRDGP